VLNEQGKISLLKALCYVYYIGAGYIRRYNLWSVSFLKYGFGEALLALLADLKRFKPTNTYSEKCPKVDNSQAARLKLYEISQWLPLL
jgi:hypothetical protein